MGPEIPTPSAVVDAYGSLDFNSPMADATAGYLVQRLASSAPADITDVGCGWAELLLRLLEACQAATGVGFRAELGGVRPSDLVLSVGAEHVFGTLDDGLHELLPWVRPGGRLLLGTLIWERPPVSELLEAFGELPSLDDAVAAAVDAGWRPLDLKVATMEDWDHFEFGFMADWERVAMSPTSTVPATWRAAARSASSSSSLAAPLLPRGHRADRGRPQPSGELLFC